jgi:hypothetical protein
LLNEKSGSGSGFGTFRGTVAACISSGIEGVVSGCGFSTISETTPGLNENAGSGAAFGFREYALECFRP